MTGKYSQETVLTENGLIESFGMSRSPVREALIRLCNDDILYSIPRYGYKLKICDPKYLKEIVRFRAVIEPAYLDKYFERITADCIRRIRERTTLLADEKFETPSDYWQKTSKFHIELAYSYRDQYFYDTLKKVLDKQWITFSTLYWNNWSEVVDRKLVNNHEKILRAIEAGNKEEAIAYLIEDISSF